jgi:hypothetical protein
MQQESDVNSLLLVYLENGPTMSSASAVTC